MIASLAAVAWGQTGIDVMENLFGATDIHAITGHGGPVLGVSATGKITLLTWPGPSGSDQLGQVASNALDAREQPDLGAPAGSGIRFGVRLTDGAVSWIGSEGWTVEQDYGTDELANIHTRAVGPGGVTVELVDAVHPNADQWSRRFELSEGITDLLVVANFSPIPQDSRVPTLPVVDWVLDGRNDFAAAWHDDAVVAWHPEGNRVFQSTFDLLGSGNADWSALDPLMTSASPDPAGLFVDPPDGSWVVMESEPVAEQVQIGLDQTPFCAHFDGMIDRIEALPTIFPGLNPPIDPSLLALLSCSGDGRSFAEARGWTHLPTDPLLDAADGELEGSVLAAGEVSTAIRVPRPADGRVVLRTGMGATYQAAKDASRAPDAERAADRAVQDWLSGLHLPGEPGSPSWTVTRRALINIRLGTDRATGAIVASPARQPSYGQDWPRDGAFFNVLLDLAGATELVDRRCALYASWQRDEPAPVDPLLDPPVPTDPRTGLASSWPADAWEMNYFPDGTPGGNLRFEIDTTAFVVWTIVAHVGWTADPQGHLREHWDTIRRATDLLAAWRDEANGLQAPAQEDDSAQHTQTLHGAIAVFGALDIAARGARLIGEDGDAERWEARASELREAMERELYDPERKAFLMDATGRAPFEASNRVPTGPGAWLVWPLSLYPLDDARIADQLRNDMQTIRPTVLLENDGGAYFLKNLYALAVAAPHHPEVAADLGVLFQQTALQATPGTHHFGETMVNVDGVPQQRVANPHLWEGALFGLTAYAIEDPAAMTAWDEVLPASRVLDAPRQGCGCEASPRSRLSPWLRR